MSVTLYFRGINPSPSRLLITGGERVSDIVKVGNTLAAGVVEIMPTAKVITHSNQLPLSVDVKLVYLPRDAIIYNCCCMSYPSKLS